MYEHNLVNVKLLSDKNIYIFKYYDLFVLFTFYFLTFNGVVSYPVGIVTNN